MRVKGDAIPPLLPDFGAAVRPAPRRARAALAAALAAGGFASPTPIQAQALPLLLAGRDVIGLAPTGSGKTLAFLLPTVVAAAKAARAARAARAKGAPAPPRRTLALVLSPTRELAAQTARVLARLLPGTGATGALVTRGAAAARARLDAHILLATPRRLVTALKRGVVDFSGVTHVVLDEADRLLGGAALAAQTDAALAALPPASSRVVALFSATLPESVEALAAALLTDPVRVTVGARGAPASSVAQTLTFVGKGDAGKRVALRALLASGDARPPTLIFAASAARAASLAAELAADGVSARAVAATSSSADRAAAVDALRRGEVRALVSTDVLARGLDLISVGSVVSYDFPDTVVDYVHRVGRTGRAGRAGRAFAFFAESDAGRLRPVAAAVRESGGIVPDWMLALAPPGKRERAAAKGGGGKQWRRKRGGGA